MLLVVYVVDVHICMVYMNFTLACHEFDDTR